MQRMYTEEQRISALAEVEAHGGVTHAAAAAANMPLATLADLHSNTLAAAQKHANAQPPIDYAALWGRAVELGAQIIAKQLARYADMDLTPSQTRDVAVIAGIASDKHLDYRDGRKGAVTLDNSQHLTLPAGSTLDDVRALRDSLRAAQAVDASDGGGGGERASAGA